MVRRRGSGRGGAVVAADSFSTIGGIAQPETIQMTGLSAQADAVVAEGAGASIGDGLVRRAVAGLGRWATARIEGLGWSGRFMLETVRSMVDVRTWAPQFTTHAMPLGVQSLPIAIYIAAFTGIVLALLASYSFTGAVPVYFVGTLVEKTVTMELAPVLIGLALAGRVGANIAAELGTMRVSEQIDALATLAYDPYAHLVVPRVMAGTLMFPVIVGVSMVVGIGAGWAASSGAAPDRQRGLHQGPAPLLRHLRCAVRSREGGELRERGDVDRLHAGNVRSRRRTGRWPRCNGNGGLFGRHDPGARRLLGGDLASGAQAMKRVNDFTVGMTMLGGIALVLGAILWTKEASIGRDEQHLSA